MKLAIFFAKVGGAGLGALGGLITFMIGLFSDKALPGTSTIGLALFGICTYLVGVALESADFETLFAPKTPLYAPQNAPQGFSDTQTFSVPQQTAPQQNYNPAQQNYNPAQQSYNPAQQNYNPAQQNYNPAQQNYNPSAQSANQSYQNTYSFDTPTDPQ